MYNSEGLGKKKGREEVGIAGEGEEVGGACDVEGLSCLEVAVELDLDLLLLEGGGVLAVILARSLPSNPKPRLARLANSELPRPPRPDRPARPPIPGMEPAAAAKGKSRGFLSKPPSPRPDNRLGLRPESAANEGLKGRPMAAASELASDVGVLI